jgi:hypothetical protein
MLISHCFGKPGMLDFLPFGRKKPSPPSDPLGSLKAATTWLLELPMGDTFSAHEKIVAALNEFNEKAAPLGKERLQVLMHLDEGAQELQHALTQQYLRNPRMSRQIESRLWNEVFSFHWQMARGYHMFVMAYVGNPNGSDIRHDIPLITARALRHFAQQAKWRYFRYETIGAKLWKHVHNLYRLSEYEEFERKPLLLYPLCPRRTTCAEEYLQLLSLDVLNTNSLFPKQIEMADLWLDTWADTLKLERDYDPQRHVFCVNLGEDKGPWRARKLFTADGMSRCWGTDALMERVAQAKVALQQGETPARLGLGEDCRLPSCLELIERITRQWSSRGEGRVRRSQERVARVKMIDVAKDFLEICALVKQDNEALSPRQKEAEQKVRISYEEMLDMRLYGFVTQRTQDKLQRAGQEKPVEQAQQVAHHERWLMENESSGGFGATVDSVDNDWVRLGKLVGLKPEHSHNWVVGVIRRLALLESGQRNVGIEILAKAPVTVALKASKPRHSGYTVDGIDAVDIVLPVSALYLPPAGEDKRGVSLIMDSVEYAPGRHFELSARSRNYSIALGRVIEKGDNWLRTSFEILQKK